MSAVPVPRARPGAAAAAMLFSLVLIGVAVVAVRDLAVTRGWTTGSTWTGSVVDDLDGLEAGAAVVAGGIVAIVLGLWFVLVSLRPARRTHRKATTGSDVWVTDNAVAALAATAAEDTPGVASATARNRRSRIAVTVQSDRPDASEQVGASVRAALDGLSTKDITVKTEEVTYDS